MTKRGSLRFDESQFAAYSAKRDRFKPANEITEDIPTLTDTGPFTIREQRPYVEQINALCQREGIPQPIYEHRFHPIRRWRFDAAWVDHRCALEIEGGVWTNGRHTRGSGFVKDMSKYNAATLRGWRVIRCLPNELAEGISNIATILTRAA